MPHSRYCVLLTLDRLVLNKMLSEEEERAAILADRHEAFVADWFRWNGTDLIPCECANWPDSPAN
jgi:hypothetical protein